MIAVLDQNWLFPMAFTTEATQDGPSVPSAKSA